ncbi:MAG: histidine kinase [Thermoanaerobacterales bacterium]
MTTVPADAPVQLHHGVALPRWVRLVGPALVAAVVHVGATTAAADHQPDARPLDVLAYVLLLAGPVALLGRLRYPLAVLGLTAAVAATYTLRDYPNGPAFTALMIAFVSAIVLGRRWAWAIVAACYVVEVVVDPLIEEGRIEWAAMVAVGAWVLVLGFAGELTRSWLERSAEQARARAEEARRVAGEERLRIARELHDVLAHDISMINVRAGVALHLLEEGHGDADPEQVRSALAAIKEASKEALGELRSVLDVLRHGEDDRELAPRSPTPRLGDLRELADRARGAGLDVRIESRVAADGRDGDGTAVVEGDGDGVAAEVAAGLPAGVEAAAFRIVQESLTNVVRHARATRVRVRVRRTDDELEVQVDDDGQGPPGGDGRAAGRGITGMAERAHALGGTLEAGPRPGRGFRVRARLPLGGGR